MTQEQFEKIRTGHRALWQWMVENPGREKWQWPEWPTSPKAAKEAYCFLCTLKCPKCPMYKRNTDTSCSDLGSLYQRWLDAPRTARSALALKIRDILPTWPTYKKRYIQ